MADGQQQTLAMSLKLGIAEAIAREEPRVTLQVLELTLLPDNNQLNIYMSLQMRNDPTQVINIERTFDIQGLP